MTNAVRLHEWEHVGPKDTPGLHGASLAGRAARSLAETLARERVLEVSELRTGISVRAFSHVGRVAVGDLVVTIQPKLRGADLLPLVRYAYSLRNLRLLEHADFAEGTEVLQDLLVAQLCAEATELVRRGLARRYVPRAERLSSPRGRLVVADIVDGNYLHTGQLTCQHHPRSSDFVLNQAIAAGLLFAARIAADGSLGVDARRLASSFSTDSSTPALTGALLADARRSLNRMVAAYEPSLRIIELLYSCGSLTLDDGGTLPVSGFLFDMNRFFQALLLRFLSQHLPDLEVRAEETIRRMIRFQSGANPQRRRAPQPRPDFVVTSRGRVVSLLDAKYRDLWDRPLPREMLYQLSMYALSQRRPGTATILYPTVAPAAVDAVLEISDPSGGGVMGFVVLRPVVLPRLRDAIAEGAEQRVGQVLAHSWIRSASGGENPSLASPALI